MDTPASSAAVILIVTDITTDATLVKNLLNPEFEHVLTSTDPDKFAGDFVRHRPNVLVMAFNTLEKSERYYLGLYRMCPEVHQYPHRTVILCSKDEMRRAYDLCKKEYFDDYILFWPMTHDTLRLPMTVLHALREMAALKAVEPSAAEFAAQARHLAELEKMLDQQIAQGGIHIEKASLAMEQTEQKIGRFKREEIQQHFRAAAESAQPLKQWAHEFKQECEPLMESARALNAMAGRIRPIVLIVDDDEFQHKIIAKLLEEENYHLIFATDGFEALSILRKTQPDIILMDVMMPNMNGMETTRRVKAISQFAKTPVIMITGKSEGKVVVDSLKAGASDFVVKPFDRVTLIDKIARALSKIA